MHACALPVTTLRCRCCHRFLPQSTATPSTLAFPFPPKFTNPSFQRPSIPVISSPSTLLSKFGFSPKSSSIASAASGSSDESDGDDDELQFLSDNGIDISIDSTGKNSRRIRSRIAVEADLLTIWNILTDYERLADFIPGLAVSHLIEKKNNYARLFQVGQQNLAFGLKFHAKGILECYEKHLESLPHAQKRDIEFEMIEGDFRVFRGKWSIKQNYRGRCESCNSMSDKEFQTTLSYVVDVEPKLWLPVRLIEGRLCRDIKTNLSCVQEEAKKAIYNKTLSNH